MHFTHLSSCYLIICFIYICNYLHKFVIPRLTLWNIFVSFCLFLYQELRTTIDLGRLVAFCIPHCVQIFLTIYLEQKYLWVSIHNFFFFITVILMYRNINRSDMSKFSSCWNLFFQHRVSASQMQNIAFLLF